MKTMRKTFALGLLAVAALVGSADTGHARPKKPGTIWRCDCTCIAYDDQGGRWEGDKLSFDTSGQDCSIGITVTCTVDKGNLNLQGAYASCTGRTKDVKNATLSPTGTTPPRPSAQLAPSMTLRR